ncbi:MAG: type 1 glutamine amidotransferase [Gammaproteobacteria bacterium]|nr:type 1 glutamine amidotransferase [Gammaproteobacteria bacterium]
MLRILVIDGNTRDVNARHIACGGLATGDFYARVLRKIFPDLAIDIVHPADGAGTTHAALAEFDGLVWTGSALNAYNPVPEVRSQIDLARKAFLTSTPMFGSCWGLQVAAIAAGGEVGRARNGREIVVARDIELTEAGRNHPLFTGKPARFDAIAVHGDEIVTRPAAMRVLAANAHSPVQAAEIKLGGGFWGTQYHPEYDLQEIAVVMRRYGDRLVRDGTFPSAAAREQATSELSELGRDPARSDLAAKYGVGASVLDPAIRYREILNWLTIRVAPAAATRARG